MIRFNPNKLKSLTLERKKTTDSTKVTAPKSKHENNPKLAEIESYANRLADFRAFIEQRKFDTWTEESDEFRDNHAKGERSNLPLIDWKEALSEAPYWKDFILLSNGEFDKILNKDLLDKNWTSNDWKLVTETMKKRFREKISETNEKIAKTKALNTMILR